MPAKIKQVALITCLFLFLFLVIGGGLHLNPGGAFLAAATGTPLVIHFFNRRWFRREFERDPFPASRSPGFARNIAEAEVRHCCASETGNRAPTVSYSDVCPAGKRGDGTTSPASARPLGLPRPIPV